jgi:hypothetical protein
MVEETMEFARVLGRLAFYWACFLFCCGCWYGVYLVVNHFLGGN